ncbi:ornithine carbamoyltransferase [Fretibacter rubidus]|uniref:ornithine carbamoyltransferase n=1 Tax=Fretibacter rubidus TaxID=570162 RepID=UPI00352B5710
MTQHFISLADIPATELRAILDNAHSRKKARDGWPKGKIDADAPMDGRTLALIFEKSSTRTRFSFDMGMRQLGGTSITATSSDMQLGRGETIEDTAKVLSRFVDGIMLRANSHDTLTALAQNASIPVINGLTDYNHPCQIMADLQTLEERGGDLSDMTLTWVGDGNNVAVSFINAAAKFGYRLRLSCAQGYTVPGQYVEAARAKGADITVEPDPLFACQNTDVVIADTFVSMGDTDADKRLADLMPYQVTDALMSASAKDAIFLHCLPAHRGEEVAASVIDGPNSAVFDEAENRLHAQKAIITWCFDA